MADAETYTETYTEYRLSGQPPGNYPFYDVRNHTPSKVKALTYIFEHHAQLEWQDVKFQKREVTITRTDWEDVNG